MGVLCGDGFTSPQLSQKTLTTRFHPQVPRRPLGSGSVTSLVVARLATSVTRTPCRWPPDSGDERRDELGIPVVCTPDGPRGGLEYDRNIILTEESPCPERQAPRTRPRENSGQKRSASTRRQSSWRRSRSSRRGNSPTTEPDVGRSPATGHVVRRAMGLDHAATHVQGTWHTKHMLNNADNLRYVTFCSTGSC